MQNKQFSQKTFNLQKSNIERKTIPCNNFLKSINNKIQTNNKNIPFN